MITYYIRSKLSSSTAKLFFLTILLSILSFNHAFNFHLYLDDWYQILGFLYFPELLGAYFSIHLYALTNSKKPALYGSLIFAVFVVGIESIIWPSGHSSYLIIPLINLGFYFWIQSNKTASKIKYLYSSSKPSLI